jgi:hypothetical protein
MKNNLLSKQIFPSQTIQSNFNIKINKTRLGDCYLLLNKCENGINRTMEHDIQQSTLIKKKKVQTHKNISNLLKHNT